MPIPSPPPAGQTVTSMLFRVAMNRPSGEKTASDMDLPPLSNVTGAAPPSTGHSFIVPSPQLVRASLLSGENATLELVITKWPSGENPPDLGPGKVASASPPAAGHSLAGP